MFKRLWILFAFTAALSAADDFPAVHTAAPANARYELVQNPQMARHLFKLDRFTGEVYQFVRDGEKRGWEYIPVIDLPKIDAASAKPRFQIFISGILTRHTFILDTVTGKTWQRVVLDEKTELSTWEPIAKFAP